MKSMIKKYAYGLLASTVMAGSLWADDTDVYLNLSDGSTFAQPLVMFALDFRPNLGSNLCTDVTSSSCKEDDFVIPAACSATITDPSDTTGLDASCYDGDDLLPAVKVYHALADFGVTSGNVDFFQILRAVLKSVLTGLNNVQVGFMLSHDDTCSGGVTAGPDATGCSNGGYILKGFFEPSSTTASERQFACDANGVDGADFFGVDPSVTDADTDADLDDDGVCSDLEDLLYALGAMPDPAGGTSHSFQGTENYFELFRYLTGGAVYNGYLGYEDFGSPIDEYNLNDEENEDGTGSGGGPSRTPGAPTVTLAWDDSIIDGDGDYISPYSEGDDWACSKTYVVNTLDMVSNQDNDSNDDMEASFEAHELLLDPAGDGVYNISSSNSFPEAIQFMNVTDMAPGVEGDQTVTSWFLADNINTTTQSYAEAGGTDNAISYSSDPGQLYNQINNIIQEALTQSSIFVAASVPVSVFNRLEIANNVYMALFQAEESDSPFWPGNVKKLKIEETTDKTTNVTTVKLVDAVGVDAFDIQGRIKASALTFWTDAGGYDLDDSDTNDDSSEADDLKDGRKVTRGGAGQQVPGFLDPNDSSIAGSPGSINDDGLRKLYTNHPSTDALIDFDADDTTIGLIAGDFGLGGDADDVNAYVKELILWARGVDVDADSDTDGTPDFEEASPSYPIRDWVMGDPMHSRPVALNYGLVDGYNLGDADDDSDDNPRIVLYYGTNDGFLHWVENTTSSRGESGVEKGAFIPRELLTNLATLRNDSSPPAGVALSDPNAFPHPYGMDGEPSVLVIDNNNNGSIEPSEGDVALMIIGMRRGGSNYYAFDISDPDVGPVLMWKKGSGDADFAELGMTFSTPKFAIVQYEDAPRLAVVFAGGYNGGWENIDVPDSRARIGKDLSSAEDGIDTNDDDVPDYYRGAGVYVVNAKDGELIWKAVKDGTAEGHDVSTSGINEPIVYNHPGLVDTIPSDVRLFDSNFDGIDDAVYVGDSGGAVWRVDMPKVDETITDGDSRADDWSITKLAELGDAGADSTDRRFFHAPDLVVSEDDTGRFVAVAIGSGDRADPTDTSTDNWFFLLKDRNQFADSQATLEIDDLADITACLDVDNDASCSVSRGSGWKLELEATGEKVLSKPLISTGTDVAEIFFTTFLPEGSGSLGSCAPVAGSGRLYILGLERGQPTRRISDLTELDVAANRFTGANASGIPSGVVNIGKYNLTPGGDFYETGGDIRSKVYWREIGVDYIRSN